MTKYLYILGTIVFTVYGQLILKWRMSIKGSAPQELVPKLLFIFKAYTDIWIVSGFLAAFVASACWMLAMTKFELSYAYPFMSASFIFVFILSMVFFNEPFSVLKLLGLILIALGIFVSSRAA